MVGLHKPRDRLHRPNSLAQRSYTIDFGRRVRIRIRLPSREWMYDLDAAHAAHRELAIAAGMPVISFGLGIEGLRVEPGKNILLADPDDGAAWIRALTGLAESESRSRDLAAIAKQFVGGRYDWKILCPSLYETYRDWLKESE